MLSREMQRASAVEWSDPDHHFYVAASCGRHTAAVRDASKVLSITEPSYGDYCHQALAARSSISKCIQLCLTDAPCG